MRKDVRERVRAVARIRTHEARVTAAFASLIVDTKRCEAESRWIVGSGVLVHLAGHCIYLTAGHCIDDVYDRIADENQEAVFFLRQPMTDSAVMIPYSELRRATFQGIAKKLSESWTTSAATIENIPYFERLDVGWCVLDKNTHRSLLARGCKPLEKDHIRTYDISEVGDIGTRHLEIFLFGTPKNSIFPDPTWDQPSIEFKSVRLMASGSEGTTTLPFSPGWAGDNHEGSVDGMSGGPIAVLGWKRPVVVAIQSNESLEPDVEFRASSKREGPNLLWAATHTKIVDLLEAILCDTPKS